MLIVRGKKTRFDESFFDVLGLEQAWLLGLLAADGCVVKDRHVHLGQSGDDGLAMVSYVKSLLRHEGDLVHSQTIRKTSHRIWFTSTHVVDVLAIFNIVPRKSLSFVYPNNLPIHLIPQFVAGYIDGDGSVGVYNRGRHETLTTSLVGTEQFVTSLNTLLPIAGAFYKIKHAQNACTLTWHGTNAVNLGEWVWGTKPVYPSRKFKTFRGWADNQGRAIILRREHKVHA